MGNDGTEIKLEDLGYDGFFDLQWKTLGLTDFSAARVIAERRGAYKVKDPNQEYLAKITGKQMFQAATRADYPAVGDWVAITKLDEERAVIQNVLARKTMLHKKNSNKHGIQIIAANLDVAFVVESLGRDFNLNRFERYFVLAREKDIKPVIVLNKVDLVSQAELNQRIGELKNRFGNIDVLPTSAVTEHGLDELMDYMIKGKTYCFLGSSGVGKSSLINKLLGENTLKTREISTSSDRGRHTTTAREMYFLKNGGIVVDSPGMREVGVAEASVGIENVFGEVADFAKECKYNDCTHMHEPSCAVLKAMEDGKLDAAKYENYSRLKKENEFYTMTDFEKRRKDRKFGQFVKKVKEQIRGIKP